MDFSDEETAYIGSQRVGRIASASADGAVDVAPVGFRFDGTHFWSGRRALAGTLRYRNVKQNSRVAFVVDDLESVEPRNPRGVKVHGRADIVDSERHGEVIRVTPDLKWSWGVHEPTFVEGEYRFRHERVVPE